jgi:DNA-binding transcriptional MerR regulator
MSLEKQSIGTVAQNFGISTHTLRYYEKIGLLPPISKDKSGRRTYGSRDIERLHFIKRAQRMHFSLKEIGALIDLDRAESIEKPQAQKLVTEKLSDIEDSLKDLKILKKDLTRMLSACISSDDDEDCPIIKGMKEHD